MGPSQPPGPHAWAGGRCQGGCPGPLPPCPCPADLEQGTEPGEGWELAEPPLPVPWSRPSTLQLPARRLPLCPGRAPGWQHCRAAPAEAPAGRGQVAHPL